MSEVDREEEGQYPDEEAAQFVADNLDRIKDLNYGELVGFGKDNGFDGKYGYPAYNRALKEEAGIDMNELRPVWLAQRNADRAVAFADADNVQLHVNATKDHYAITTPEGDAVWTGRFFDEDAERDQNECDLDVAKKAIYLAGKVAESTGGKARLQLVTSAKWLEAANKALENAGATGGKANKLVKEANKYGVDLVVMTVPGSENAAKAPEHSKGRVKWQDGIENVTRTIQSKGAEREANCR